MKAVHGELRHSLRFLSGKNQGGEFALADPTRVTIGRAEDADLSLQEGMVSRRHARLAVDHGILSLEDLGSTNGTFVNGAKIAKQRLEEGDRILIGTSILKVILGRAPVGSTLDAVTGKLSRSGMPEDADTSSVGEQMNGVLEEVSVAELLEMFGVARQKITLDLEGPDGPASVLVAEGRVRDCQIERLPDAPARKCLLRVLGYERGTFNIGSYRAPRSPGVDIPVPELLVEGLFQLDQEQVLRQRLPLAGAPILVAKPMVARLSSLDERDLEIFQLAYNLGEVDAILDASPEADLEVAKRLLGLIDQGYLRRG